MEAFDRHPVQQNQPPQIQQDPLPSQPPPSPEECWADPDEFLASSDLYLAQVPSPTQKHKFSSDSATISTPIKSPQPPNEPDDKEDIQQFLGLLDRKTERPPALNSKPKLSLQQPHSGPASLPSQASVATREGSERDSTSQQTPYNLRIPPPRRAPKEKDPPDLDFREDHFG
ncbi:MAG: hypothetical protein OHK93_005188 [Ramalina farinacea]|uniref:Uncharacterized protein n=1 Tax=Ramalina farinacea TaxID=258253 RepID=A0AA43QXI3_9LECA|nr:hypothetical protein [Ramalina farinacea]